MISKEVGPVNLGNPKEISVLDFAEIVIKIIGCDSKMIFKELPLDDPRVRRPNIERANDLLNWQPDIPLEKGLIKTIEYFKDIT